MKTVTMNSQGQITIPAKLRRKYGFQPNQAVLVRELNQQLVVEPVNELTDLGGALNKYALKDKNSQEISQVEKKVIQEARRARHQRKNKQENTKLLVL